ncbi:hypothetical protein JCM6882_005257 [Rhodosporidiobolus microsporus]
MKNRGYGSSASPSSSSRGSYSPGASASARKFSSSPATSVSPAPRKKPQVITLDESDEEKVLTLSDDDDDLEIVKDSRELKLGTMVLKDDARKKKKKPGQQKKRGSPIVLQLDATPEPMDVEPSHVQPQPEVPAMEVKEKEPAPAEEEEDSAATPTPAARRLARAAAPTPTVDPKPEEDASTATSSPAKRGRVANTTSRAANKKPKLEDVDRKPKIEDVDIKPKIEENNKKPKVENKKPKAEDKKLTKEEKKEVELEEMRAAGDEAERRPRPDEMAAVNSLDPSTCEGDYWIKSGGDVEELVAERAFNRTHLRGTTVQTSRRRWKTGDDQRICTKEILNLGPFKIGKPFVFVTDPKTYVRCKVKGYNLMAVFMQVLRGKKTMGWKCFGWYEIVWAGKPDPGEFEALDLEKRKKVVDMLMAYIKEDITFRTYLFQDCDITDPDDPTQRISILSDRVDEAAKRERIEEAMLACDGSIRAHYCLLRFVGVNRRELNKCRRRRQKWPRTVPSQEARDYYSTDTETESENEDEDKKRAKHKARVGRRERRIERAEAAKAKKAEKELEKKMAMEGGGAEAPAAEPSGAPKAKKASAPRKVAATKKRSPPQKKPAAPVQARSSSRKGKEKVRYAQSDRDGSSDSEDAEDEEYNQEEEEDESE